MAAAGSWPGIAAHGLRSTTALLDLFEVTGSEREVLENRHRPEYVSIRHASHGQAWIRDQKAMDDAGLKRALAGTGWSNTDWYRVLNRRVFFWLTEERLRRMLNARAYRKSRHTVIVLKTAVLVEAHLNDITLSPINSGSTKPMPSARGPNTFQSLRDFPYEEISARRRPREVIVELAVDYMVPRIADYVLDVRELNVSDLPL